MKFRDLPLDGACLIELEPQVDERGFFARSFCVDELADHGKPITIAQENVSFNRRRGTLRGMHLQREPNGEVKIVRCTRGAIYDVIVDVRAASPTRARWTGVELTASNRNALYVPRGFAHGFLTLEDDTEVAYAMGSRYVPGAGTGYRYDDPAFAIAWPFAPVVISPRDLAFSPYSTP